MSNTPLLPNRYKNIGWLMLLSGFLLGYWHLAYNPEYPAFSAKMIALVSEEDLGRYHYFQIIDNNILDELIATLAICGALLVAFTKESKEDEYIQKMRLDSLIWATILSYLILILIILFVYDFSFFTALVVNMLTIPMIFIVRFNWLLHKSKSQLNNEE